MIQMEQPLYIYSMLLKLQLIAKLNMSVFPMFYFYNYPLFQNFMPLPAFQNQPIQKYNNDQILIPQIEFLKQNQKEQSQSHSVNNQMPKAIQSSRISPKNKNQKRFEIPKRQNRQFQKDSFTQKRNIIPNNINHILAYVQRKSKSSFIIQKIIRKQAEVSKKFTSKNFYCYQNYLENKLQIHVNKNTLQTIINHLQIHSQVFSIEQQLFYNRVCRIAIFYYLRNMALLTTLNSKRLKQMSKSDHLRAQRILIAFQQQHESNR